jgi:hypothetical protein
MKNTSKTVMIAAILMIAVVIVPVTALSAGCAVPPDGYFITDGAGASPAPAHEGIQLGYVWNIGLEQRIKYFSGSHYLGFDRGTYALKESHNEQEWTRFGEMYYCFSTPDYPYDPQVTFTSEDPSTSIYEPAHASAIFR